MGVSGAPNSDYSLYLDLVYADGTPLWGQVATFAVGTHDWQRRKVLVVPKKPVRSVTVNLLLRRHAGRASFRDASLSQIAVPDGAISFDGVAVSVGSKPVEGFQLRDVAANSDFVRPNGNGNALGVRVTGGPRHRDGARFFRVDVRSLQRADRAVTLVWTLPIAATGCEWLEDPRRAEPVRPGREYVNAGTFRAGANGRLSKYPFAAVTTPDGGRALGIDMTHPAFFRVGYNAGSGELFIAWDIGLTYEQPRARLRFCVFDFDPAWGFRAALDRYHRLFPEHFRCRTPKQGLWMPFAPISEVAGWQDFGFRFKEGTGETAWDDAHDIVTFRYTEPMTWWMRLPKGTPRTMEAANARVRHLAENGSPSDRERARALLASGYRDENGQLVGLFRDTPWCDGVVWSQNSMPGIVAPITDFKAKWNAQIRERLYGPSRKGDLDGEYVDSSEGYVTAQLDFCRDHFVTAKTPLTFSWESRRPAIFRGLIAYEYVRAMADDVHGMGKLMMANSTPIRLCWLAPWLDVMGTETNWNPGGTWRPMSDADLLYRRSLCGPKPYCFLMNTNFDAFSHELVEKYMKRAVAYGMFPGFFSADASTGQYFRRPDLYERDRPLFKKYVPICTRIAEAGWRPITGAWSSDPRVTVERFGDRYLTVFNHATERVAVDIRLADRPAASCIDLVSTRKVAWRALEERKREARAVCSLGLDGEGLAVIDLRPAAK